MEILINCPKCGNVHKVDIPEEYIAKERRKMGISDEVRAQRAQRMRELQAAGKLGRKKKPEEDEDEP